MPIVNIDYGSQLTTRGLRNVVTRSGTVWLNGQRSEFGLKLVPEVDLAEGILYISLSGDYGNVVIGGVRRLQVYSP